MPYINSAGNWIFYAALNRELIRNLNDSRHRTIHREMGKLFRMFIHLSEDSNGSRLDTPKSSAHFLQRFINFASGERNNPTMNRSQPIEADLSQNEANETSEDEGSIL
ncbi:unnamed protein product [Toxocara canis]|uniref:Uncharacterized protein n=1 Tax=Toxocara canis TaxID=6265 RepID=A0A3P7GXP9_TOXCA|nr:unnamed protein product [Toxocara canis]